MKLLLLSKIQPPTETAARVQVLTSRLERNQSMDIESMSRKEKRTLRKEVINRKRNEADLIMEVFISLLAGIIIILLLLILLL
jgi:hypothetical protein